MYTFYVPSSAYRRRKALSRVSFSLIAAVFLLLSTSLAAGVAHQFHQITVTDYEKSVTPKYLVIIVLDGARTSYFHIPSLPHFQALLHSGTEYTRAWDGILESETPAGHATLGSGSTPARDGLLGFNWVGSDNDAVHVFDPGTVRQGTIEHVMERAAAPTIAADFKARFHRAKVVALSGHKYYAADPLGGPSADYIMYYEPGPNNTYIPTAIPNHMPPESILKDPKLTSKTVNNPLGGEDHLAMNLAIKTFNTVHQRVSLINLPEFDWPLGHVYGADRKYATTLMRDFDQDLGNLEDAYRKAGVLDQTLFVVTADHGMMSIKHLIPDSVINDAIANAGANSLETTFSTASYIWLQDPKGSQAVANNIVKANDPNIQSVYDKVSVKGIDSYVRVGGSVSAQVEAVNQYLLRSFLGGNAPNVVAFCKEDVAFEKAGAENWKGNHGGGSWASQHIPLIFSGPGVKAGVVSQAPARLQDVAPTVLTLMGAKPTGMEGRVLADALRIPTKSQISTEANLDHTLNPLVDTLSSQSKAESKVFLSKPAKH